MYRNANHRSFNIGATAPQAQNLAVPNHTTINQLIFIMAPSFSLPMICHILHGGCNFPFYGADPNSDEAGKYAAAPQAQKFCVLK